MRLPRLALLPEHEARIEVLDGGADLLDGHAPVSGTEDRACLRCHQQQLEELDRVLSEPEKTITRLQPVRSQRGRQPVHALVELRVAQSKLPVDRSEGVRSRPTVLTEEVAKTMEANGGVHVVLRIHRDQAPINQMI